MTATLATRHDDVTAAFHDGEDHDRLRALAYQAFTPRRIEHMREQGQQVADELLDRALVTGSFDLLDDYARPLPQLTTHDQESALLAGEIDVGLLRPPVDERLAVQVIREDPYVAAVPSTHLLAEAGELDLADLAGEDFVYFPREMAPGVFDRMIAACAAAGFSPHLVHRADRPESAVVMVSCGLGVLLVSGYLRRVGVPEVTYRPLRDTPLNGLIAVGWRPDVLSPAAQSFLTAVETVTGRPLRMLERTSIR
ncbi:MAG TPA: LysR substrate-binding domain-containing protein [Gemmatirosa sp.]